MATVTDRDRTLARELPDEFLSWPGIPLDGLLRVVVGRRHPVGRPEVHTRSRRALLDWDSY
jgi:hypothetical protein